MLRVFKSITEQA